MNNLSEQPKDPKELLSEAAQKRINRAFTEGSRSRDAVRAAGVDDPEAAELSLSAANFAFGLLVVATEAAELRYAGVRGREHGEIICHEIECAANSLELGAAGEHLLAELLLTDWGW